MMYRVRKATAVISGTRYWRGDTFDPAELGGTKDARAAQLSSMVRAGWLEEVPDDLSKLTKAALVARAEQAGLEVPKGATKADLVDLLEE